MQQDAELREFADRINANELHLLDYISSYENAKTIHARNKKIFFAGIMHYILHYVTIHRNTAEFTVFKNDMMYLRVQCKKGIKALRNMHKYIKIQTNNLKRSKHLLNDCLYSDIK